MCVLIYTSAVPRLCSATRQACSAHHSLCNSGSAEGQDPKCEDQPPIIEKNPENPGITLTHLRKDDAGQGDVIAVAEGRRMKVRAAGYKRLDLSGNRNPCVAIPLASNRRPNLPGIIIHRPEIQVNHPDVSDNFMLLTRINRKQ